MFCLFILCQQIVLWKPNATLVIKLQLLFKCFLHLGIVSGCFAVSVVQEENSCAKSFVGRSCQQSAKNKSNTCSSYMHQNQIHVPRTCSLEKNKIWMLKKLMATCIEALAWK